MKLQTSFLLCLFLLVQACSKTADHHEAAKLLLEEQFRNTKLINQFKNPLFKDTAHSMTTAQFSPLYIGQQARETKITYNPREITKNRWKEWDLIKPSQQDSLLIYIDNSRIIGTSMDVLKYPSTPENRPSKIGYPVFIKNKSKDTLIVGFGDVLPIIIEAQDKQGVWKPIQHNFMYTCGFGLTNFYLKPDQIAITSMKIFDGHFKTRLRLAYGYKDSPKVYSNEIVGNINETQFYESDNMYF